VRKQNDMAARLIAGALAAALCGPAAAQTVYESKDKSGAPVFSDNPAMGGKAVDLPPPNVVKLQPVPKLAPLPAAPFAYRSIGIVLPEGGDTVHSNTGGFGITIKLSPALRARLGDRIRVTLDGNPLPAAYASRKIAISDAAWQAAATSNNAQHTLQATVLNGAGAVMIESAPLSFYVHRATAHHSTH